MSENAMGQINVFEDRCNLMNINELQNDEQVSQFLSMEAFGDFPADLWNSLEFKTRVLCPMPQE
jgi:hypothetical protein